MLDRFMVVLVALALGALLTVGWHVANQPVQKLKVAGELSEFERASIEEVLASHVTGGILQVDLLALADELEDLSWAHEVGVRREWPHTLSVSVQKLRPVARWSGEQYISAQGQLLTAPESQEALPEFDVRLSTPKRAMETYLLLEQIAAHDGLSIQKISEDGQGEWELLFANGIRALLGSEQLTERLRRLLYAYRAELAGDPGSVMYIDARYLSGVAIKFVDDSTLTASVAPSLHVPDGPDNGI